MHGAHGPEDVRDGVSPGVEDCGRRAGPWPSTGAEKISGYGLIAPACSDVTIVSNSRPSRQRLVQEVVVGVGE